MSAAKLVLYSRRDCCLCDDMKSVIQAVAAQVAVDLTEIDVDDDPILQERYGDEVPVLLIDGRKAAKFRIAEATLLRRLKTHQIASWMIKFLPGR